MLAWGREGAPSDNNTRDKSQIVKKTPELGFCPAVGQVILELKIL